MSDLRNSHLQKTVSERGQYLNSLEGGPTIDSEVSISGSNTASESSEKQTFEVKRNSRPRKNSYELYEFFKETELYKKIVIPLFLAYMGWMGYTIFSLNREVGSVQKTVEQHSKNQEQYNKQFFIIEELKAKVDIIWNIFINKNKK